MEQDMFVVKALAACTGLQKQGRQHHKPCFHMSEAVKKQLVLGQCGG